ncbi:hypothetical protein Hanom_Chr12g01067051 [Helianthus anomalus]
MSIVHLYILLDLFKYLYVFYSPKSNSITNPKLSLGPSRPTSEIHYVTTYQICKLQQNLALKFHRIATQPTDPKT